ncbi:MAG: hypothetical protein HY548_09410, partial [Elusimicrobia bacterium]|nr:hypothetical protein [Elusimicrobiota bacterium]
SKSLHGLGPPVPAEEPDIPAARDLRQLVRHAQEVIDALDYLPFLSPAERSGKLWRTFLQWRVRKMDLALLHGFLRHVQKRLQKSR